MDLSFIRFEKENGVGRVWLNRPDVLNSFHKEMALELQGLLSQIAKDDNVRAVLLSGEGRAFCAGQDLSEVVPKPGIDLDLGDIVRASYNPIIRSIRHLEKPVVAAVNGIAAGAGANLALACDIVIASNTASFIQSFSKVGLIPDSGGTFLLPRLVGLSRATSLMLLGEKLPAEKALEMGLIYKVVPGEALLKEAIKLAEYLATQPTFGLGLTKRALNRSWGNNLDAQLDAEEELQRIAGQTQDYSEGVNAFLEKRPPTFTGK